MKKTLWIIRIFFFLLCLLGSWLVWYSSPDWSLVQTLLVGGLLSILVILVDLMLKGFSLRGLSALSFGLAMGALLAFFIEKSPLFEYSDPQILYIVRMALYVVLMYLGCVIALRGKDEFHLIIPYVRFLPQKINSPLVVLDMSALIDGRILGICACKFLGPELILPRFVLDGLKRMSDSQNADEQAKGRKGLEILNQLKEIEELEVKLHEIDLGRGQQMDDKLVFVAKSLKAKLLTTDYSLAKLAEFHGVDWLNIHGLAKAIHPEFVVGQELEVKLIKEGKDPQQAVGYLSDGSMVVVDKATALLGQQVSVEVINVISSAGGRIIFARVQG